MPRFTRRHYVVIAEVLATLRTSADLFTAPMCDDMIHRFAGVFGADNPAFNRVTFFTACGVPTTTSKPPAKRQVR